MKALLFRYNGLVNTKAVGVSVLDNHKIRQSPLQSLTPCPVQLGNPVVQVTAAADNKGFVLTTKRSKLSHKPAKATLAVTMKAGLGRSLHKVISTFTCGSSSP